MRLFFQYLAADCEKETLTYLSWVCIPNNKTLCEDISNKSGDLKENLKCTSNNEQNIFFTRFQKFETKTKKIETIQLLAPIKKKMLSF